MTPTTTLEKAFEIIKELLPRFLLVYLISFIITLFGSSFLEPMLQWFSDNILGWSEELKLKSTGSGDRIFDYVRLIFNAGLALFIFVLWFLFKPQLEDSKKLNYFLQLLVRILLFFTMMLYGLGKVFKGQFPDHTYEKLVQTIGELSPMGLAWTFMGHSHTYNLFLGSAEVIGGLLMLSRKTKTLGSIVILGIMTNVFIMNMTYDIPVKIVSAHIILLALILFVSDGKRLLSLFIHNENTEKIIFYPNYKKTKTRSFISFLKKAAFILISGILLLQFIIKFDFTDQLKDESEFYGLWETDLYISNSDTLPPLLGDKNRWHYFIVDTQNEAIVKKMNNDKEIYQFEISEEKSEITFFDEVNAIPFSMKYTFPDSSTLRLTNVEDSTPLEILMNKKTTEDFLLTNRGFHWVNETAYGK